MYRKIFCILLCIGLILSSCNNYEKNEEKEISNYYEDELNIMHIEADNPDFKNYINDVSRKLNMKINIIPCPDDANNRQAEISTLLLSGNSDIDLISVNDEMVSEFKVKGYIENLDDIMSKNIVESYPKDYIESVAMYKNHFYSVPYLMDIMMFWVNEKYIKYSELEGVKNLDDFSLFVSNDYGTNMYGYGSAWDETYIYNDLSQFINMFDGDYYNWNNDNTKEAVKFLYDMLKHGYTPQNQMIDRYEQMEQKFIDGKYGCVFMYSGSINIFLNSGKYGKDGIHVAELPMFKKNATNIAAWQYVLNKASKNKNAAKKFLSYISSREGSIDYSNAMKQIPARIDVILEEDIDVPDIDIIRKYVEDTNFKVRPLSSNPMNDISEMGRIFQKYLLDEIELDDFCDLAQTIADRE